jgi:hypothetical protein
MNELQLTVSEAMPAAADDSADSLLGVSVDR